MQRTQYIRECSRIMDVPEAVLTQSVAEARGEVVEKMRQRRAKSRLAAENDRDVATKPEEKQGGGDEETGREASALQQQLAQKLTKTSDPSFQAEKNVMEYVVKYGMCPLLDEEQADGRFTTVNVAEYVNSEMSMDGFGFETPLFARLFNMILGMKGGYTSEYQSQRAALERELEAEREKSLEKMRSEALSIAQMEKAEQEASQERVQRLEEFEREFAAGYIGKELASVGDDEVRRFVTQCIVPPPPLSKYHSKHMHIPTELERIEDLVPRAINEWKWDMVQKKRTRLAARIQEEPEKMIEIMEELQNLAEITKKLGPELGDRIIVPKR